MIKYLEEQLFLKTKDSKSDILYAQWNYDKKLIPLALANISNIFPHYSLHDESHSIAILNNIARIIGKENLGKFSAIDIWLLLESSYLHDIGMVVSGDDLKNALKTDEFISFFKELLQDTNNGLYESANLFEIEGNQLKYRNEFFNIDMYEGIKYLIAEYFRRKHSERSKEIIINPAEQLSLLSPRCIIPERIFKILGEICSSHTKEFTEVLKLPFCEVGIDIEDAHPKFIACLLRVGDLLDLDNNRFSEVMLRTLSRIPLDTLIHKSKHLSIESFRVDKTRIEIIAKCLEYDTATITQHWFNYLNLEISNQMINWNDIVPNIDLGYLPTIGNLKVELLKYDFIDGKNKPRFSVDTDKALSLLQGAGIYEGPYQCIREILQNSVDASLIRLWLEYHKDDDFENPNCKDFIKYVDEFPVKVCINAKGIVDKYQRWEIIIKDKGIGISNDDLKYLMSAGSASKNLKKLKIIDSMPKWMRPSGTFGIGFQSIFMLAESVTIKTKSFINEEFQKIELNSPSSIKQGDILVQKNKTSHSTKPGVELSFIYKIEAEPVRFSIKSEHLNANKMLNRYDPFFQDSLDIEIGKIIDEIFSFSKKSCFPILLSINNEDVPMNFIKGKQFSFYDSESVFELNINSRGDQFNEIITYYKNQQVKNNFRIFFLSLEINIHKDKASEVLTLNRNKLRADYEQKLLNEIYKSVFKQLLNKFNDIFQSDEDKCYGSMFLNYYSEWQDNKDRDLGEFNHWEKFNISFADGGSKEMKKVLEEITKLKLSYKNELSNLPIEKYCLKDQELTITINRRPLHDYTYFLFYKASLYFKSIQKIEYFKNGDKEIIFIKESGINNVKLNDVIHIMNKHTKSYSTRAIIPCLEKYINLALKEDACKPYVLQFDFDEFIYISIPKMLSPYISLIDEGLRKMEFKINDRLIDWVFDNRLSSTVTKENIRDAYKNFEKDISDESKAFKVRSE